MNVLLQLKTLRNYKIQNVENLVRLETRNANTEGKGAITIRDLIKFIPAYAT